MSNRSSRYFSFMIFQLGKKIWCTKFKEISRRCDTHWNTGTPIIVLKYYVKGWIYISESSAFSSWALLKHSCTTFGWGWWDQMVLAFISSVLFVGSQDQSSSLLWNMQNFLLSIFQSFLNFLELKPKLLKSDKTLTGVSWSFVNAYTSAETWEFFAHTFIKTKFQGRLESWKPSYSNKQKRLSAVQEKKKIVEDGLIFYKTLYLKFY